MSMFVTSENIRLLRDSTGKPFTDLIDSLIRSEAAQVNIPVSAIHTNPRTNLSDGGVDTAVDEGRTPSDYLGVRSLWQFKAMSYTALTDDYISHEIHDDSKEYARELIRRGYAYRLCICDDCPAEVAKHIEAQLHQNVSEVNRDAPPSRVLTASQIADWANRFLAIRARILGLPVNKFFIQETWRAAVTVETPIFVPPPRFDEWKQRVEVHLDWSRVPTEVNLSLYGDADVGKTRSLFEILESLKNHRELVLYTDDDEAAIELATGLANVVSQNAVLVVDECLSTARTQLVRLLRGSAKRVRLITIDNARERTRILTGELRIEDVTEQGILRILELNFPSIPQDRRLKYARFADGSLRFAIFMCRHDSEIASTGRLDSVLLDAHDYYQSKFANGTEFDLQDKEALEIVSLVDRVGYKGEVFEELEALCRCVNRDARDVAERIEKIRTRIGIIANFGRYCRVTPRPIAMAAFHSAWEKWVARDPDRFLQQLPPTLVQPFHDRVASASPEVGATVSRFFRNWAMSKGPSIFESVDDTRQFLALVQADPSHQVHMLRQLVEAATPPQLGADAPSGFPFGGSTSRRLLISLTEELAQFREYFDDAEAILLRIAMPESEPSIGNNATNTWKGIFRILLSGTELPFKDRLERLISRANSEDSQIRYLAVSAAAAAVDRQPFRAVGPPLFGSLLAPPEWRPSTYGEYYDSIQACLTIILKATRDNDEKVASYATSALLDAMSHLLWGNFVEPVRKALEGNLPDELKPKARAVISEIRARIDSPHAPPAAKSVELANELDRWLKTLEPSTIHAELVENLASGNWRHHFDQEQWIARVESLAARLHVDAKLFGEELDWLYSDEAKSAAELGQFFGSLDASEQKYRKQIFEKALETGSDGFARGYVYGVARQAGSDFKSINSELDLIQSVDPRAAFFIMLPAGDAVRSFDRALEMVGSGKLPARILSNVQVWVGDRKTSPDEAGRAAKVLLKALVQGDSESGTVAIDFVAYQLNRVPRGEKVAVLREIFPDNLEDFWTLLDAYLETSERETFWFAELAKTAADLDPERGCALVARMATSGKFRMKEEAERLVKEQISQSYPTELMNAIGRSMQDSPGNSRFFIQKFDLFSELPFEIVQAWLERTGVVGARTIARHLKLPFVAQDGVAQVPQLTRFVLTRFENDDRTFQEFVVGAHSLQGYWGNYSEARSREADVAGRFLKDESRRVREWANIEIKQAEEDVRIHRLREEEQDL